MPIYCYECDRCDHHQEEFQSIRAEALTRCPNCGTAEYHRVPALTHSLDRSYIKPIEMYSIAVNTDEEIRAFIQRNPDAKISTKPADPLYGVPVARSRAEKLRILKHEGFVEKN